MSDRVLAQLQNCVRNLGLNELNLNESQTSTVQNEVAAMSWFYFVNTNVDQASDLGECLAAVGLNAFRSVKEHPLARIALLVRSRIRAETSE